MKDGACKLQLLAKLRIVRQIAVMSYRHAALDMVYDHGLTVEPAFIPRRRVPDMPDRHASRTELCQNIFIKNIIYEALIAMRFYYAVIVDGNACALLTAVLESVKSKICACCDIALLIHCNTDHAAFLMQRIKDVLFRIHIIPYSAMSLLSIS